MTMQRIAINTAIVLGTILVLFLLYEFHEAVIIFLFSLAVAAATRPYVETLSGRGMPRNRALLLVYLLFILFLLLLLIAGGSQLLKELQMLSDNLARMYDQIWKDWPQGTDFQKLIIAQLPTPPELYASFSPEQGSTALSGLFGFTMSTASLIGQLASVIILSLYWSMDRVHFERLWLSLLPVESRARARDIWRDIERDFGAYVRSEVLQSILAGILIGMGLWLMRVPYPFLLGLFAALAWLIPWLGGVMALLPVALASFTQSLGLGILATAYALGVLFFLEFFIEPRFIRRQQYNSLLTILLIIALVEPFGLLGLIIAPPLAATIQLIFRYNLQSRPAAETPKENERLSELRARVMLIRKTASKNKEELEPQTLSLLDRLETLLDRADEAIDGKKSRGSARRVQA